MAVERKRNESILYKDFLTQREWHHLSTYQGEISAFSNNYFQFLHWKFSTQKRMVWKLWSLDSVHFLQTYVLNMFSNLYFSKRYRERQEQHQKFIEDVHLSVHSSFKHLRHVRENPRKKRKLKAVHIKKPRFIESIIWHTRDQAVGKITLNGCGSEQIDGRLLDKEVSSTYSERTEQASSAQLMAEFD